MEKTKKRHKIVLLHMVICAHILCLSQYVFAQQPVGSGKTSKHGRYCYCEKGKDTVLTVYRAVWLNTDTIPSVAIKADSASYIINQIKRELGGEIAAFLKKNQLFLDDYFRLSRSTGKEELVHINMCEVLNSQYGYKKYNQYAKKLGRIVRRINLILNDQTNAICELEISTAPKTVVLDDVILVQSSVCDKKKTVYLHTAANLITDFS